MSFFGVQLNAQINRLMFELRLHLSKNKYMPNVRTIYRTFCQYDPQITGLISSFNFEKALNQNGYFMRKYDVQVFQKAYNDNGKINWFNFLSHLKEPMGPYRRELVEKIFDQMDQDKQGKISAQSLMQHFNFNEIETYRYGRKTREQITEEFLSMLNLDNGFVTRDEFIAFYNDLNINFGHNQVFFRYVSMQWFYEPEKEKEILQSEVRKYTMALRGKLLQRTQGSKDQLLIHKIFKEYDQNGNSYLGSYDVDNMAKKLGIAIEARLVESVLHKIDKNQSGYVEFDDFKRFLYHNPYPY